MDRRTFMTRFLVTCGAVSVLYGCKGNKPKYTKLKDSIIEKNSTILFQGDSITDAGRDRKREATVNDKNALGDGYVSWISTKLFADRAEDGLKIYNRGISGDKVFQLAERWQKDCLDIKPDVLSILVGVNDFWHLLSGQYDGTLEKYEQDYRALLQRTLKAMPDVKLVICEPFVLRCGAVDDAWFPAFDKYRAVAKKMSEEFDALFVPFQAVFDEAVKDTPPKHFAEDGVHPTVAGASLMGSEWLRVVNNR